jgi:F-box and WD-40 domain protein 1/11
MDISEAIQSMHLERPSNNDPSQEDGKKVGGIRGFIRRASISMKSRQRRHSHAVEERPQTAWHRLKTATSFHRHSRFLTTSLEHDSQVESHEVFLSPIPGNRNAPPLIPHGYGGAAARATAAAQNEYLARNRQLLLPEDQFGDRESGIGIAVTVADSVEYSGLTISSDISRVDFIAELPAELAIQILESLDHATLRNTIMVSKRWKERSSSQHVWKRAFMREQSRTYATSKPVALGSGLGLPNQKLDTDWKDLFRIREELRQNWMAGTAEAVYLNGHLDSIYCVQFDE